MTIKAFFQILMTLFVILLLMFFEHLDVSKVNFESYTVGTVDGQDGWSSDGAAGSGCAVYDHEIVDSTGYGYYSFGRRSLRISNAVVSECFSDQTFSKPHFHHAGELHSQQGHDGFAGAVRQPDYHAEWDFASTVPGAEQPGLSVIASPDRGDGARMSWVQMKGTPTGLEVNFLDYQEAANPAVCDENDFVLTNLASGLVRTVPHTIKIRIDFMDGSANDIVKAYVDGILKHTGTTWEDYYRNCENNPPRIVDSILFWTGEAAAPATTGNGFLIDNLEIMID